MIIYIPLRADIEDFYRECIEDGMTGDFESDDLYYTEFDEGIGDRCIYKAEEILEECKDKGFIEAYSVCDVLENGCGYLLWTHYVEVDVTFTDETSSIAKRIMNLYMPTGSEATIYRRILLNKYAKANGEKNYEESLLCDVYMSPSDEFIEKYKNQETK